MSKSLQFFFAACGLVLTVASLFASVAQYQAASLQADAAMATLRPQIQVTTYLKPDNDGYYAQRDMVVTNAGGPAYNVQYRAATWLAVKTYDESAQELRLPLNGYFSASYSTGNLSGELVTYRGYLNNKRMVNLDKLVLAACASRCSPLGARTLVSVAYEDALNNRHQRYVLVGQPGESYLSEEDGAALWKEVESYTGQTIPELETLQDESSVKKWLESSLKASSANG